MNDHSKDPTWLRDFEAKTATLSPGQATEARAQSLLEDITESLRILLNTRPGERVMQPEYGCRLPVIGLTEITDQTRFEMGEAVKEAISVFEPRIVLNAVDITAFNAPATGYVASLDFTISATGAQHVLDVSFRTGEGKIRSTPAG